MATQAYTQLTSSLHHCSDTPESLFLCPTYLEICPLPGAEQKQCSESFPATSHGLLELWEEGCPGKKVISSFPVTSAVIINFMHKLRYAKKSIS